MDANALNANSVPFIGSESAAILTEDQNAAAFQEAAAFQYSYAPQQPHMAINPAIYYPLMPAYDGKHYQQSCLVIFTMAVRIAQEKF